MILGCIGCKVGMFVLFTLGAAVIISFIVDIERAVRKNRRWRIREENNEKFYAEFKSCFGFWLNAIDDDFCSDYFSSYDEAKNFIGERIKEEQFKEKITYLNNNDFFVVINDESKKEQ